MPARTFRKELAFFVATAGTEHWCRRNGRLCPLDVSYAGVVLQEQWVVRVTCLFAERRQEY